MKRVTSIGGVFFKCNEPEKVRNWYKKHLGLNTDPYGTTFEWNQADNTDKKGFTQWSPIQKDSDIFKPSKKDFIINYRVENLEWLVKKLENEGVTILDKIESYEYGKFVHIMDLEGNKIELWEPFDTGFEKIAEGKTK